MIVPDVNLLVYAYHEDDPNHEIKRLGHHVDGQTDGGRPPALRSEPNASLWMHLIFPISWSRHGGQP